MPLLDHLTYLDHVNDIGFMNGLIALDLCQHTSTILSPSGVVFF